MSNEVNSSLDLISSRVEVLLVMLTGLKDFNPDEDLCPFDDQDMDQINDLASSLWGLRSHFRHKYGE